MDNFSASTKVQENNSRLNWILFRAEFPVNALIGTDAIDTVWSPLTIGKIDRILLFSLVVNVERGEKRIAQCSSTIFYFIKWERISILGRNSFSHYFHLWLWFVWFSLKIERINNQSIKRDKLSQALLICFIDRCTNLPVRKKKKCREKEKEFLNFQSSKKSRREPNPFCRIRVDTQERRTPIFESKTDPRFEHSSQIFCANPLHQKLSIEVLDARSNNELIGFFEIPIKHIYDSQAMTIDTQAFPLRNVSEPLDRANIVLRLSLFVRQSSQCFLLISTTNSFFSCWRFS